MADAASAVIGHESSVSKPGSRAGPVLTVTVQCQTAILSFSAGFFPPSFFSSEICQLSEAASLRPLGLTGWRKRPGKAVSDTQRRTLEGEPQSQQQARKDVLRGLAGFCVASRITFRRGTRAMVANGAGGHIWALLVRCKRAPCEGLKCSASKFRKKASGAKFLKSHLIGPWRKPKEYAQLQKRRHVPPTCNLALSALRGVQLLLTALAPVFS